MAGLCAPVAALAQQAPSAQDIVRRADEARFPREGFEVLVNIRTLDSGRVKEERLFKVLSKGKVALARTMER